MAFMTARVAVAQGPAAAPVDAGKVTAEHPPLAPLPANFPLPGPGPAAPATWSGGASPYLIGVWDHRGGQTTFLHIINPTGQFLNVLVVFFDDQERPLLCRQTNLTPNDVLEVDTRRTLGANGPPWGVVKIVALDREHRPVIGLVGNQRLSGANTRAIVSETSLHNIQPEVLNGDWEMILKACRR
jgi:hypothetical protein